MHYLIENMEADAGSKREMRRKGFFGKVQSHETGLPLLAMNFISATLQKRWHSVSSLSSIVALFSETSAYTSIAQFRQNNRISASHDYLGSINWHLQSSVHNYQSYQRQIIFTFIVNLQKKEYLTGTNCLITLCLLLDFQRACK